MNRRELLASVGAAGTGLVAGCSDGPLPYVGEVVLNGVFINNHEDERHEVRVVVETDEETHTDRTVVCDTPTERDGTTYLGGAILSCTWPDNPGQYTVRARHDGEWQGVEFPDDADERCVRVIFSIGGHPRIDDTFEALTTGCPPEDGARCGYNGDGWPEDPDRQ
jgi:hypothetical protein